MKKFLKVISILTLLFFVRAGFALSSEQVYFYYNDPVGTPLAISDASGNVVWRADYLPFGEETIDLSTVQNSMLFVGKEKDSESGLYYFDVRYMDPSAGRFCSPDSVGAVDPATGKVNDRNLHDPQLLNKYAYGLNNPYRYVDIDGQQTVPARIAVLIAQGNLTEAATIAEVAGFGIAPKIQQSINSINSLMTKYSLRSGGCDKLAKGVFDAFKSLGAEPQLLKITPTNTPNVVIGEEGFFEHYAVKVGETIYDAYTGGGGMSSSQYAQMLNQANTGSASYTISAVSTMAQE